MKRLIWYAIVSVLFFSACDKTRKPEDADDNYITSIVLAVDGRRYAATILDDTITIAVPDTVALNKATAEFRYTRSASIVPKPETIKNWGNECTFRVTSYNGAVREYAYRVERSDIVTEGTVVLASNADVASFAKTKTVSVKGNLIIGSDASGAEPITDIQSLSCLQEVTGIIKIRSSFAGSDLTGLENVQRVGGLQIGTSVDYFSSEALKLVSMSSLREVSGDIVVYADAVELCVFDALSKVDGSVIFCSPVLAGISMSSLTMVSKDVSVQVNDRDGKAGGNIALFELPKLVEVGGVMLNGIPSLIGVRLPALERAHNIRLTNIGQLFSTLEIPKLVSVDGVLRVAADAIGNTELKEIMGISNVTRIGMLSLIRMTGLELPSALPALTQLCGLELITMEKLPQMIDISNAEMAPADGSYGMIRINNTSIEKIQTKDDLSRMNVKVEESKGIELTCSTVHNFSYRMREGVVDKLELASLKRVLGNLDISIDAVVSFPSLQSVDGYVLIDIVKKQSRESILMPSLETVGGQLYLSGTHDGVYGVDFRSLRSVCTAENPAYNYRKKGVSDPTGSFTVWFRRNSKGELDLPKLEKVGGDGILIKNLAKWSAPALSSVEGYFIVQEGNVASDSFELPGLKKLGVLIFSSLEKFTDFEGFAPLVTNKVITDKSQWSISDCGYNPTFDNMKKGLYTKEKYEKYQAEHPGYK